MSYRELQLFSELMKCLGYGRLISISNFRSPNFELVADILYFFVTRMGMGSEHLLFDDDISTKSKRIEFLKNCCNILANKTQIKLKLKCLYGADGYAVKELLKIARFLDEANKQSSLPLNTISNNTSLYPSKLSLSSNLSAKIVENGLKLHSHLGEIDKNININSQMAMVMDISENHDKIKKSLNSLISDLDSEINSFSENKLTELSENKATLTKKIKSKENELLRLEKRLKSLKNIRPSFEDEYRELEFINMEIYNLYCSKIRNLSYLQNEYWNKYKIIEMQKLKKQKNKLTKVQKILRMQELNGMLDTHDNINNIEDIDGINPPTQSHTNSNSNSGSSASSGSSSSASQTQSPQSRSSSLSASNSMTGSISDLVDENMQF